MQWFRKLFPKKDARSKPSLLIMKWFKKSTVDQTLAQSCSPLQTEIDVVPKTEFSSSRQTLNNINIALKVGESSGVTKEEKLPVDEAKKIGCDNKYCCGAYTTQDDYGDDDAIKNYKNSKSTLIDNLQRADNNEHTSEGLSPEVFNETDCRRPNTVIKEIKNGDYIVYYAPCVEYGKIEFTAHTSWIEHTTVRYT